MLRGQPGVARGAATLLEVLLVVVLGLPEGRGRLDLRSGSCAASEARPGARPSYERAASSCSGEWKKIAERYCEPTSNPCRLRERGLCLRQKTSSSCSYETCSGSNSTSTASACPVRSPADLAVGGVVGVPAGVADAGGGDAGDRPERRLDAPEAPGCECGFLCHVRIVSRTRRPLQLRRASACPQASRRSRPKARVRLKSAPSV